VYSLCTALGGSSVEGEQGVYVLGDDALACLRDIRRWLKLYDEKLNRLDVSHSQTGEHMTDSWDIL
jgi:replication fork protection complex subunit Tof1/Swi1